ncbi:hypothetical protein BC826DRAFT_1132036 [Russula brevipes]|nr:hypothetical protein BC826DRAFT_1132036 [Russula brevipes]
MPDRRFPAFTDWTAIDNSSGRRSRRMVRPGDTNPSEADDEEEWEKSSADEADWSMDQAATSVVPVKRASPRSGSGHPLDIVYKPKRRSDYDFAQAPPTVRLMDLGPLPPPPPNPNPKPNPPDPPPDNPPDPPLSSPEDFFKVFYPKISFPRAPDNPYRGPVPEGVREAHRKSLEAAKKVVMSPFSYRLEQPLAFDGSTTGIDVTPANFNAAVEIQSLKKLSQCLVTP